MTADLEANVRQWRAETTGCDHLVHLNNKGSSLPPAPVLDTVIEYLRREAEYGGYEASDATAAEQTRVYASIAALIGADPGEIALVENATRAWDMAFYSVLFAPGDRIITGV